MSKAIVPATNSSAVDLTQTVDELRAAFQKFKQNRLSANTRRAYESQWQTFVTWSEQSNLDPYAGQPAQIAAFVAMMYSRSKSPRTLTVALSAIKWKYREAGLPDPTADKGVQEVVLGARRTMAEEGLADRRVNPTITLDELRRIVNECADDLAGVRNRTLVLVAYGGWMRRSELLSLKAENITWKDDRAIIRLPRSKTNQEGTKKENIVLVKLTGENADLCPYSALRVWLDTAQIHRGPVFRHVMKGKVLETGITDPNYVYKILDKLAIAAGVASDKRNVSPHRAFRASPITAAIDAGEPMAKVMKRARHKSTQTTTAYYDEAAAD